MEGFFSYFYIKVDAEFWIYKFKWHGSNHWKVTDYQDHANSKIIGIKCVPWHKLQVYKYLKSKSNNKFPPEFKPSE